MFPLPLTGAAFYRLLLLVVSTLLAAFSRRTNERSSLASFCR
jgi:hypothetical protein